jgi:hypothetical protein
MGKPKFENPCRGVGMMLVQSPNSFGSFQISNLYLGDTGSKSLMPLQDNTIMDAVFHSKTFIPGHKLQHVGSGDSKRVGVGGNCARSMC